MKRLDSISFASVVMISSSCLFPSAAETPWRGVNEQKWAEWIQSDISNQASAETICTNSTKFATTSKDATFKVWANSIAQTYCNEDNDENGDQTKSKNQDVKSEKPTEVKGGEGIKNEDKISMGTIGMDAKSAMEPEASDEEK